MIYRRFGKTGLRMPVLSAGFMRAMHSWKPVPDREIPEDNQVNFDRVVRQALAKGINHFETARGYGTSEQQLGMALREIADRDSYLLQTKIVNAERSGCLIPGRVTVSLAVAGSVPAVVRPCLRPVPSPHPQEARPRRPCWPGPPDIRGPRPG